MLLILCVQRGEGLFTDTKWLPNYIWTINIYRWPANVSSIMGKTILQYFSFTSKLWWEK